MYKDEEIEIVEIEGRQYVSLHEYNLLLMKVDGIKKPVKLSFHLRERMEELKMTQTELSKLSDVRQATISKLSRGEVEKLHVPTLESIASVLGIEDIRELISFESRD